MDENIVKTLRELASSLESHSAIVEQSSKEVSMWRERFLNTLPKYEDPEKAATIWATFLFTPATDMMLQTPEVYIKILESLFI